MHLSRLLCCVAAVTGVSADPIIVIGSYTEDTGSIKGTGEGIYSYALNTTDGSLKLLRITPSGTNPTYVQGTTKKLSTGKRVIYAVNSVNDVSKEDDTITGFVSALTLDDKGTLEQLNKVETKGGMPVHVSVSPSEDFIIVSNYGGGFTLFPLNADGSLANGTYHQRFMEGSNVVMHRQTTGHIQSSTWLLKSKHVVVANLGSDKLLQYELDQKNQSLKLLKTAKRPAGSGPRSVAVHPSQQRAYVVDELSNTVGVYKVKKNAAVLSKKSLQEITTLPSNFTNSSASADIHLSSNGKFLYTSNRGHDSIAMFKIESDGTLTSLGWESTRGKYPCGFMIYDKWLIVANQYSNDMYVFEMDSKTGLLSYTGNSYEINSAVSFYIAKY